MLPSQRSADDSQNGNAKGRQKNRPFDPDGFALMFDQFWKQVKDGDAQAVDGMEQGAKENKDLEHPVLVNGIQESPNIPAQKRRKNMHGDEDPHAQSPNAMQDERQHWTLSFISQACQQADISF
jgi:hypothetical protein